MARALLTHGAWGQAKAWGELPARLCALGHDAAAIDLPGHGADPTPPETVGLEDYAARIVAELERGPPAALIGHSMGGMAISAAAEAAPERVTRLIYVAAFLPRDGDSLVSLKSREPATIQVAVRAGPAKGTTVLDPSLADEILCHDASAAQREAALTLLGPQPSKAQVDPLALTAERFGRVPRHYILCRADRTVTPELQRAMATETSCATLDELPTGHLPQLTAPEALASLIHRTLTGET
ncbi:Alpha/beta hydrolase family protein [Rhodovulum sp. ES.010]|uniref:alpha/beta fold hydrolase n=1 Tax=Rhodovulum sp. ES.010 TaxID=1882821 RepID=UPI00092BFFA2|nr:alpha/beta hydrolase [Rhodovulum sp. ES.010]SIO54042.1 Alpha/beta hydrolase family protein [Rhodovulum sp. ES.010]